MFYNVRVRVQTKPKGEHLNSSYTKNSLVTASSLTLMGIEV